LHEEKRITGIRNEIAGGRKKSDISNQRLGKMTLKVR
jgi:hypothetical protein